MQDQTSDFRLQSSDKVASPFISICIPAYKRTEFLKRLVGSIEIQTFRNFEVVVTDDSPGNDVEELCKAYQNKFVLHYYKNIQQLGTPENWNEAIRKSKGKWIKLMHDDDWLHNANSLQAFADAIKNNPGTFFFFSAYRDVYLDSNMENDIFINRFRFKLLLKNPATLLSRNIIGPPSVTLHRNDCIFLYDKNLKWLVDIDFYMHYVKKDKPFYIDKILVNVGLSSQQVTKEVFRVRNVELPENFYLLNKMGVSQMKNIYVYDAWWRLMRNLNMKSLDDARESGYHGIIPIAIKKIIDFQRKLPGPVLKIGLLSKFFMFISFIRSYNKIDSVNS
jgi:glycosyltransferase involved in cell wall biosynthesis